MMKKRIVSLFLCVCMAVTVLIGCGGDGASNGNIDSDNGGNEKKESVMPDYLTYLQDEYKEYYEVKEPYTVEIDGVSCECSLVDYYALSDVGQNGTWELFYILELRYTYMYEDFGETGDVISVTEEIYEIDAVTGVLTYVNGEIVDNNFDNSERKYDLGYIEGSNYFCLSNYLCTLDENGEILQEIECRPIYNERYDEEYEIYIYEKVGIEFIPTSEDYEIDEEKLNEYMEKANFISIIDRVDVQEDVDGWFNSIEDVEEYIKSEDWKNN